MTDSQIEAAKQLLLIELTDSAAVAIGQLLALLERRAWRGMPRTADEAAEDGRIIDNARAVERRLTSGT